MLEFLELMVIQVLQVLVDPSVFLDPRVNPENLVCLVFLVSV